MQQSFPKYLYIFDLDGTLALTDHRTHLLANKENDPECWRRFYAACDKDTPCPQVLELMETLRRNGHDVIILSGRSDEVRDKTEAWLVNYTSFTKEELDHCLIMRKEGDHRTDIVLKEEFLKKLPDADRNRLTGVFEDRSSVVKMWRDNGVQCYQVAYGNF